MTTTTTQRALCAVSLFALFACSSGTKDDDQPQRGGHSSAPDATHQIDPNELWTADRVVPTDQMFGYPRPPIEFVPERDLQMQIAGDQVIAFHNDGQTIAALPEDIRAYVGAAGFDLDYTREEIHPEGVYWAVGFSNADGFVDTELELAATGPNELTGKLTNWYETWEGEISYSAWRIVLLSD